MSEKPDPLPWNWPPHMQAAYRKWEAEQADKGCGCLTCLQIRMRRAQAKATGQ